MISIISAPTHLGLRPPEPGGVPGTAKAPEALREAGLHRRLAALGARDAGVVLPGRYVDDDGSRPSDRVRNEQAMVDHARRLATRTRAVLDDGAFPLILGGDCSVILGVGVALSDVGRVGLVHLDGHTDFRHPGNSDAVASVAGEDLAAAVGLHRPAISDIDGRGPYFDAARTAHIGCRDDDEEAAEAAAVLGRVIPASLARERGMPATADDARSAAGDRFWLQLDVDILDPRWMPAVDSADPGGLDPDELLTLLRALLPGAVGLSVTIYDPDLDPGGACAALLVDLLVAALDPAGPSAGRWTA